MHLKETTFSVELPVAAESVLQCALSGDKVECLEIDYINGCVLSLRPWFGYDCDEISAI